MSAPRKKNYRRTEYAYTTGTLGTPTDTVTYTYSDTEWGDLLTGYGSVAFSYDGIGNLTNDVTYQFTFAADENANPDTGDNSTLTNCG